MANADGALVAAVFVLLRVTEVANGIILRVVVGVVRAPDAPAICPVLLSLASDDTIVMTRGTTFTRPGNESG